MLQTNLPGVVVGISDVDRKAVVLAEVRTQEIASTVYANATSEAWWTCGCESFRRRRRSSWQCEDVLLAEWPAIAPARVNRSQSIQLLAQESVAWIGVVLRDQSMTLSTYIREGQDGIPGQLPFN